MKVAEMPMEKAKKLSAWSNWGEEATWPPPGDYA